MKNWALCALIVSQLFAIVTSVVPTFSPTPIPSYVQELPMGGDPIAKHQLVVVPPGGSQVIQLTFYDPATTRVRMD